MVKTEETDETSGRNVVVTVSISKPLFRELEQIAASRSGESQLTTKELIAQVAECFAAQSRLEALEVTSK